MAKVDAIGAARAADGPVVHGEDDGVTLRKRHHLGSRLHARTLLGQHEFAPAEIPARCRQQDRRLERKRQIAIKVLMQAVVVARTVLQQQRRRTFLARAVTEVEKVRVPLDQVAERKASPISAMPAGLHEKISPVEMADLLTYLAQVKSSRTGSRHEALDVREIPRAIDYVRFTPILDQSQVFQRPVWFGPIPGRPGAQLVLEIDQAKIWLLEGEGAKAKKSLFIDLSDETTGGEFTGLMSLAFHPDGTLLASGGGQTYGTGEVRRWELW